MAFVINPVPLAHVLVCVAWHSNPPGSVHVGGRCPCPEAAEGACPGLAVVPRRGLPAQGISTPNSPCSFCSLARHVAQESTWVFIPNSFKRVSLEEPNSKPCSLFLQREQVRGSLVHPVPATCRGPPTCRGHGGKFDASRPPHLRQKGGDPRGRQGEMGSDATSPGPNRPHFSKVSKRVKGGEESAAGVSARLLGFG